MKIKLYPLAGVKELEFDLIRDNRGYLTEILRTDNHTFFGTDEIKQINIIFNYPKSVRAWHRHSRNHIEYFVVLKGCIKICAYDEKTKHLIEIISSDTKPKIVRIPGFYWHGIQTLSNESAIVIEEVTKLYDYKKPDKKQISWDSDFIQPKTINGCTNDFRIATPYRWFD